MGKKKKRIAKITEEQYFAYIAGLKNDAAPFDGKGDILIPTAFASDKNDDEKKKND